VLTVPLTRLFRLKMPDAQLSISEGLSSAMQENLQNGRLDIAVLYNPTRVQGIEHTPLGKEELLLVQPRPAGLQEDPPPTPIRLQDVAALPLVIPTRPNAIRMLVESEMAAMGCSPQIALEIDGVGPEKRLDAISALGLMRSMLTNAIGPALLMKHFIPLLASDAPSVYATLSARVGSIEDNRKGGWYGYRAAKAARNMLLQSAAIEASRRRPLAVFAALQPGTVRSKLSRPFVAPSDAMAPEASASQLLQVLQSLKPTGRAQFVDFKGASIPW
jgi:DNA-binding transcriptional LysR family regulator